MAARYARLTVRATWSSSASLRAQQTEQVSFFLGGQWHRYRRGGQPGEFTAPDLTDPDANGNPLGPLYLKAGVENLVALIQATIQQRGLLYTVSAVRDLGGYTLQGTGGSFTGQPVVEFDITATAYDTFLDLNFSTSSQQGGWATVNLSTIKPVLVYVSKTDATIYGSATGSATLYADGNGVPYTFAWSDGVQGANRAAMQAGTYFCTVTDMLGESARVEVIIKQDDELQVRVIAGPDRAELVPSGGVAPYTYLWDDGSTAALRTGLSDGTYTCVVSDAHGASKQVQVVIAQAHRYWWSGNPITLTLAATAPDTIAFTCQAFVETAYLSGVFVEAGPLLDQPAVAGATTFEVQELLEPFVRPQLPGPGLARQDGLFARFYLQHAERSATGTTGATTVQTNYLLHGGLSYLEAAAGTWFAGYQSGYLPFLSWEPRQKKVLPDQPEYLYVLLPDEAPAGFAVEVRLTYADGSTALAQPYAGPPALRNEVFSLAVGPAQLGLPALEAAAGQLVARYQVRVLDDQGQPLSQTRTFVLDRRPCPVRRYFLYANSLGGWNTLACRGRGSRELATTTQVSENTRAAGYDPTLGDYTIGRRTGLPTLKCFAGTRSAEQAAADEDFLLSERVLLVDALGRYLAGKVKDAKFVPLDDDETRRTLQFDYELPRERYYTPALQ